jgi:hypothetical protein
MPGGVRAAPARTSGARVGAAREATSTCSHKATCVLLDQVDAVLEKYRGLAATAGSANTLTVHAEPA